MTISFSLEPHRYLIVDWLRQPSLMPEPKLVPKEDSVLRLLLTSAEIDSC